MTAMTTPATPPEYTPALEYATPAATPRRTSHWLLVVAVSLSAGMLFANTFGDAAGFAPMQREEGALLRSISGALIALLVGAASASLIRFGRRMADALARATRTPDRAVGFALLGCGTVCVLTAAGLEVFVLKYGGFRGFALGDVAVPTTSGPALVAQALCVLILLAGAALVATGVWAMLVTPRQG